MTTPDPRIPIRFGSAASAAPGEVVFAGEAVVWGTHEAGCACCGGRPGVAQALSAMFMAAMRGPGPMLTGMVADLGDDRAEELRAALRSDRFLAARFVAI
jgi:hypothetical protein